MQRLLYAVSAAVFLLAPGITFAQDAKAAQPKSEGEIRRLLAQMEESFSRRDAAGVAACWTPQGDFVGQNGVQVVGREKIEKGFREAFASRKPGALKLLVLSLRLIGEDVALVDAVAVVKPRPVAMAGEPVFQLVLVKRDDRWLIETARETISPATEAQPLKELQWMVGDWVEEGTHGSGIAVHSECDWSLGGTYLIRKFSAEGKKGVVRAGTEVIGWDPRQHRIRSWMFDSNGSFGESTWVPDGKRWIVKHKDTLTDGGDASVTYVITPVDTDTITVRSKEHIVNGEKQPALPEIKLKRRPTSGPAKSGPSESPKSPEHALP